MGRLKDELKRLRLAYAARKDPVTGELSFEEMEEMEESAFDPDTPILDEPEPLPFDAGDTGEDVSEIDLDASPPPPDADIPEGSDITVEHLDSKAPTGMICPEAIAPVVDGVKPNRWRVAVHSDRLEQLKIEAAASLAALKHEVERTARLDYTKGGFVGTRREDGEMVNTLAVPAYDGSDAARYTVLHEGAHIKISPVSGSAKDIRSIPTFLQGQEEMRIEQLCEDARVNRFLVERFEELITSGRCISHDVLSDMINKMASGGFTNKDLGSLAVGTAYQTKTWETLKDELLQGYIDVVANYLGKQEEQLTKLGEEKAKIFMKAHGDIEVLIDEHGKIVEDLIIQNPDLNSTEAQLCKQQYRDINRSISFIEHNKGVCEKNRDKTLSLWMDWSDQVIPLRDTVETHYKEDEEWLEFESNRRLVHKVTPWFIQPLEHCPPAIPPAPGDQELDDQFDDPKPDDFLSEQPIDPKAKHTGELAEVQSPVPWGELTIVDEPKPVMDKKATMRKAYISQDVGLIPRDIERYPVDKRIFRNSSKRLLRQYILFDCSGSMGVTGEDVQELVDAMPWCTIAFYSGEGDHGTLHIVAADGRKVEEKFFKEIKLHGGNVVDGPSLQWLLTKNGVRIWVSDKGVTGINDQHTRQLKEAAIAYCRAGGILTFGDAKELIRTVSVKELG